MNRRIGGAALVALTVALGGCSTEVIQQGYVQDERTLGLVDEGSSREQVLLTLGTPSTVATFDSDVFYYISQQRQRSFTFQRPTVVDQKVLAVYFNENDTVQQIANYTLQDGQVFDTITRTTPTSGKDQTFLQQIIIGGLTNGKGR